MDAYPSENGQNIALFQGPLAEKHLEPVGLRLGARYRLHKKNRLSGELNRLDDFVEITGISEDT